MELNSLERIKYVSKKNFPQSLSEIHKISPKDLPITAYARMMCTHCGLYNRAILCPPLLYKTYPQYSTIDMSRKFVDSFDFAFIYVFKNDGSKRFWYKKDQESFNHFRMRKVTSGRQLKGIEAVGSRYITKIMFDVRKANRKLGYKAETYIMGHCDMCYWRFGKIRCPNRDNPPCKFGGMPSLESIGINVYSLLEQLGVEYEYPVKNYLTSVTMMLIGRKQKQERRKNGI
jgi:predicted metal-binding protein